MGGGIFNGVGEVGGLTFCPEERGFRIRGVRIRGVLLYL
jgi:hypothetical protein